MSSKNTRTVILILGGLAALGPFSIDMYLPGFPQIAQDLRTDIAHVTLSLTSYFIGISLGQLIYGPLLDRFGRKKPLLFGLMLYTLASLGCSFVTSVQGLIVFRLLMALGGCAGMVAVRAIVRDVFPVNEIAKTLSSLMLVMGAAPIIAPTVGGLVVTTLGWRSIFLVLVSWGLWLLFLVFRVLPESKEADASVSLNPGPVLLEYLKLFRHPGFMAYSLCGGLTAAGMFAYISGSPFVFMNLFGLSERQYGWVFGLNAMGLIASSQLTRLLLRWQSSAQIVRIVATLQCLTGLMLVLGTVTGFIFKAGTLALVFSYLFLQGFLYPTTSALALEPFAKNAGAASGLIGFLQMVTATLASALVSVLHNGTALPMTGVMAGCTGLGFCSLLGGELAMQAARKRAPATVA
jgi:MFS transporter, DHA1 family, multidrug resistance protein